MEMFPKMIDISGQTFGYLEALRPIGKDKGRNVIWECLCICGKLHCVTADKLKSGNTKSCGCMTKEMISNAFLVHGSAKKGNHTRLYNIWALMRQRCQNPNNPKYPIYGGRGICICDEWDDFREFYNWAIQNGYADDLEIDRINVNGNYEPSNCRWVTDLVQARNTTRCKYEKIDGDKICGSEIAEKYGLVHKEYKHMMYLSRKGESMLEYAANEHDI